MSNLFDKAKTLPAKKPAAKKPEAEVVQINGLAEYAAIDSLEKTLKSLKETIKPEITNQMIDRFIDEGKAENFKGKDGDATASLELRKRSSASGLTDIEKIVVEAAGITTVETEDRPETYIINPAYVNDTKLLEKVSKAISKIQGLPEDFLMFQESSKKTIVGENALQEVFKLNDEDKIRTLLPIVGTFAIKPKTTEDTQKLLLTVGKKLILDNEAKSLSERVKAMSND